MLHAEPRNPSDPHKRTTTALRNQSLKDKVFDENTTLPTPKHPQSCNVPLFAPKQKQVNTLPADINILHRFDERKPEALATAPHHTERT